MSRLGRSQPVQPSAWHGFVDPGPGPVGTTPPPILVVDRADQRARYRPLDAVVLSGVLAFPVVSTATPTAPVVVEVQARRRLAPDAIITRPAVNSGVGAPGTTPPPPVSIDRVDQRVRYLPLPAVAISATRFVNSGVGVPGTRAPAPTSLDRVFHPVRYRALDPQIIRGEIVPATPPPSGAPLRTLMGVGT